jgi:hypothetical protein
MADRYRHPRRRLLDGRSSEARRLKTVLRALVEDLGGEEGLTPAQRLILGQLREKLVALAAITMHLDKQASAIGEDGQLIPALRRSHLAYSNSVRRDIEALHGLRDTRKKKIQSLEEYVRSRYVDPEGG